MEQLLVWGALARVGVRFRDHQRKEACTITSFVAIIAPQLDTQSPHHLTRFSLTVAHDEGEAFEVVVLEAVLWNRVLEVTDSGEL